MIDGDTGELIRMRWLNRPANQEYRVRAQLASAGLTGATIKRLHSGFEVRSGAFESGRAFITDDMLADQEFSTAEFERLLLTLAREGALTGA